MESYKLIFDCVEGWVPLALLCLRVTALLISKRYRRERKVHQGWFINTECEVPVDSGTGYTSSTNRQNKEGMMDCTLDARLKQPGIKWAEGSYHMEQTWTTAGLPWRQGPQVVQSGVRHLHFPMSHSGLLSTPCSWGRPGGLGKHRLVNPNFNEKSRLSRNNWHCAQTST